MLVKKIKSEWKPSEKPGLQVGETIEMTDPRQLILDGACKAVGADGEELDAFDLYGVVDQNLVDELKAFKNAQHQIEVKKNLEAERVELEAELAKLKKSNAKKYEAAELEAMEWQELRKKAIDAGVFKPDMKKKEVIQILVAKI
jgi:hypothetical protein